MALLTASSARVKDARKLSRRSVRTERRLFLADGPKAVEGALEVPGRVVEVFATAAAAEQYAALPRPVPTSPMRRRPRAGVALRRRDTLPASSPSAASSTSAGRRWSTRHRRLVAVCADVRDPGQRRHRHPLRRRGGRRRRRARRRLGRPLQPQDRPRERRQPVPRALRVERDPAAAVRAARDAGLTVLAADGGGEVDLFEADDLLAGPTAWLFGNEAWGLPAELAELADHRVRIPIHGRAESLNLATAAALCLYASARRSAPSGHSA